MKNNEKTIFVKNLAVSKKFYSDILGLSAKNSEKGLVLDDRFLLIESQNPINTEKIVFETDYFTETLRKILSLGTIELSRHVDETDDGRRFLSLLDPDGNSVWIEESVDSHLKNLIASGKTAREVASLTSLSIDKVISALKNH